MNIFKKFGEDINYKDIIQLDGSFSALHMNYDKSLTVGKINDRRKDNLSFKEKIKNVNSIYSISGTEHNLKKDNKRLLWEDY